MAEDKAQAHIGSVGGVIFAVVLGSLVFLLSLANQNAARVDAERRARVIAQARTVALVAEQALASPFGAGDTPQRAVTELRTADPDVVAAAVVQEPTSGGGGDGSALGALMASLGGRSILAHTDQALVGTTLTAEGGGEGALPPADLYKYTEQIKDNLAKNTEALSAREELERAPFPVALVLPAEQSLLVVAPVMVGPEVRGAAMVFSRAAPAAAVGLVPWLVWSAVGLLAVSLLVAWRRSRDVDTWGLLFAVPLIAVCGLAYDQTTAALVASHDQGLSSAMKVWQVGTQHSEGELSDTGPLLSLLNQDNWGTPTRIYLATDRKLTVEPGSLVQEDAARWAPAAAGVGVVVLSVLLFVMGWARRAWRVFVEHWFAYAYIAPAMAGMFLLVFAPFLYGLALAFFERIYNEFQFVGVQNFVEILGNLTLESGFYFTFAVTVFWTVANVFLHVSIGLGLALLLKDKSLAGTPIYRTLLIVPWAVPNYITALIWKGLFHKQFGAINSFLELFGVEPVSWFDTFWRAFAANLATNTWLGFPFMMVVSLGALQSIPTDLYEAADVDGAGRWDKFWRITVPLLKPALFPAIILGIIWTFNMFNVIYLVSGGAPDGKTDILITEAYRWAFERGRYGYAAAYSTIIFTILVTYTVVTNRLTRATEGAYE